MLDLGNDLFLLLAAAVGGAIGVSGSVIGARITGRFMLEQQEREFRQRANDAVRALLVELEENHSLIIVMQQRSPAERLLSPDPARLKDTVWETQLPLIAGFLKDGATLSQLVKAYRSSETIRRFVRHPDGSFHIGVDQNNAIITGQESFREAINAVRRVVGDSDKT